MRVLVTGGAGYIGSHTVRCLLERGHDVLVYDNLSMGHRRNVSTDRLVVGDLLDAARLDHAMLSHRVEAVVHFAARAFVGESVREPLLYWRVNVTGTLNLIDACRRHGVGRLVFSSTCATYGTPDRPGPITEDTPQRPINPYGYTKLVIEEMLDHAANAHGLGYAALRYFNAAGAHPDGSIGEDHTPETHLIPLAIFAVLGRGPRAAGLEVYGTDYPTPDGTCIRDYIHVNDLAEAHLLALERIEPGRALRLNLGTGRGASVREVIAAVEAVSGRRVPVTFGPRRAGDPAELVAAADLARTVLGWTPKYVDLRETVATAWRWHSRSGEKR